MIHLMATLVILKHTLGQLPPMSVMLAMILLGRSSAYAWKQSSGMGVYLLVSVSENMYITTYSQFLDWTTLFPWLCTTNSKN